MQEGHIPDPGYLVASLKEGTLWLTKSVDNKSSKKYYTAGFKFVVPFHPIKANYHLYARYSTGRIVNDEDSRNLGKNFPGLLNRLEEEIAKFNKKVLSGTIQPLAFRLYPRARPPRLTPVPIPRRL